MLRILIVDDERIEREGIQKLIRTLNLELETLLAENGEAALNMIAKQSVDIMITDIKMPFMDGLELSEKASELNRNLEIIIYSAYNDFEYARRALRTKISNYLLKPIQIAEFLSVLKQAIDNSEKREAERLHKDELLDGYNRGLVYEKEKMLKDALNGVKPIENRKNNLWTHLILIDCGKKFFDIHSDSFNLLLSEHIVYEFDYLNLNEHQSVLFIKHPSLLEKETLRSIGERIVRFSGESFSVNVGLVIGKPINDLRLLYDAFNEMEQMLEFKFFMEDNVILFTDEQFLDTPLEETKIESILEKIYQCLNYHDAQGAQYSIELLFSYLKAKGQLSSLYIKFICSEIMKKAVSKENKQGLIEVNDYLDRISKIDSLLDLKELMFTILSIINPNKVKAKDDSSHKLIRRIKELIEQEYSQDISLEGIAEKVFLTPSYLSYLFKKETGQSLVRYITQVRMEKAVELLSETNMKIVDMYEKLGFRSSTYFIQTFRSVYGVTPAKFRETSS